MTWSPRLLVRRALRLREPVVIHDLLSPGANAVLEHAVRQGAVTTAQAAELLDRDRGPRRPPRRTSLGDAHHICLQLVDDGWLTYAPAPNTWRPTTNTTTLAAEVPR